MAEVYDALVIGAGPAGLAASRALSATRLTHVVLERGVEVGQTWANLYDGLVLHTTRTHSALPGLRFRAGTPRFPTRVDLLDYLREYARVFSTPVEFGAFVVDLRPDADGWTAHTAEGRVVHARTAVVATGIASNPFVPSLPGRDRFAGPVVHAANYRRPDPFAGTRVLVVGAGNSAADIAVDLARTGASVFLSVRSGAIVVPRTVAGIPIQYLGLAASVLSKPAQQALAGWIGALTRRRGAGATLSAPGTKACSRIPIIGRDLPEAIASRAVQLRREIAEILPDAVRFADGATEPIDAIVLATGFRAAIDFLPREFRRDACGLAERSDSVTSADRPGLYFVGHDPDIRGGLYRIGRDAALAARRIRSRLADRRQISTETRPRRHGK